jgi:hypothetical protein
VATVVEESGVLPLLVVVAVVEEGRTVTEMTAPKRLWSHRPRPA